MTTIQRIPKWLLEETSAEIYIARGKPVCVRLYGGGRGAGRRCFNGFGDSIADAAKESDQMRSGVEPDQYSVKKVRVYRKRKWLGKP